MAQWWDEWQLRILVLASLAAQYFLVLFAVIRKFHISPALRLSFRLAHTGSDALALFALATLFARQRNGPRCSYTPGSRDLELFWAPILLMHLGGQVVITTYKIEDNEQWSRYILKSLSKVAAAVYVFYKTWSSNDKMMFLGTVILFLLVIIRCIQKALALKSSSFNALRKTASSEVKVFSREETRLEEFVQQAKDIMDSGEPLGTPVGSPSLPYQLFLDSPCSYSDRLTLVRNFRSRDLESALRAIEGALSAMTSFLYTKDDEGEGEYSLAVRKAPTSLFFRVCTQLVPSTARIAVTYLVVRTSHKEASHGKDTDFTACLLQSSILLDVVYLLAQKIFRDKFSGRIHQHSLIGLFAHNKRHATLRRIAGWFQCKDLVDGFWRLEPSNSCKEVTELVRLHVETGWAEYIRDSYCYRMFNDTRGEWTLARNRCLQEMGWSTRRPFDESIVLWHLATDLYIIHHRRTSPDDHLSARRCKLMSNYMMHLLSDNPEMLMPGSRKSLLATVCEELGDLFDGQRIPRDKEVLTRRLFEKCEVAARPNQDTATLIGDAWGLAQSLLTVDETRIWELIQGMWVEMLCFSASRCRGYLHAEALGTGVEYLSYVWVLLAYTGMETFPEKLERRECNSFDSDDSLGLGLARESGDAGTPLASQSEGTVDIVLEP